MQIQKHRALPNNPFFFELVLFFNKCNSGRNLREQLLKILINCWTIYIYSLFINKKHSC